MPRWHHRPCLKLGVGRNQIVYSAYLLSSEEYAGKLKALSSERRNFVSSCSDILKPERTRMRRWGRLSRSRRRVRGRYENRLPEAQNRVISPR
jgi:hypothetical protein